MNQKKSLTDYTESEFLHLIEQIKQANRNEPDHILGSILYHFSEITEHPRGYDLIFKPENEGDAAPHRILTIVKDWRQANGKTGFKEL
ncbi:bacteriocin immunity protein [Pseudomonas sp. MLB6B]